MADSKDSVVIGLTDRLKGILVLAGISLLVACGITLDSNALVVRPDLNDIIYDTLIQYVVLAVAIERAAAVFVAMTRSRHQVEWQQRIRRVTRTLDRENPRMRVLQQLYDREQHRIQVLTSKGLMAAIAPVNDQTSQDEYIGYLTAVKYSYEFQLARFQSIGRRYTSIGVLLAGTILAGLGLSLFDGVFANVQDVSGLQYLALRGVDIIITGGLVGGGSAGLSAIIEKTAELGDNLSSKASPKT